MRHVFLCALTILFGTFAAISEAQQGTADLRGRVVDAQQAGMPGVTIVVRNLESGTFRETSSGADGSFFVSAMNPGVYQVEATLEGFNAYKRPDVRLEVGKSFALDVRMDVGAIAESVTVKGEAPLVDTTSKEVGGNISAEEFVATPSFNRSFSGFLGMVPGVVSTVSTTTFGGDTISVGGQGARNVVYTMDGSDNNDGLTGGGTSMQARIPIEAVQEFKVVTSQFDAEYGGTSGAVVNAVSKQGTNALHGSAFGFFQDQNLSAMNYFAKAKGLEEAPTTQQQYGGTIGGPIVKDKAHYFFSLERIILDNGITTNIPSRPDLNRNDFQVTRNWNTFIRFDNQINNANTWGVRWLRENSPQPVQLNETWTRARRAEETDVDQTLVGTLSSVVGSTRVNTLRMSYTSEVLHFANPGFLSNGHDQVALLPTLVYASFEDQQSPTADIRKLYGYTADDSFSWYVPNKGGDHELKFGATYGNVPLDFESHTNENATFVFGHDLVFNAADPRTYPERMMVRVPGTSAYKMTGHYIGGYAQDKWKVHDRVTVSLGARYDIEMIRTPNQENPLFTDNPGSYPIDKNNVAPRLGLTYALDKDGRSALRGGAGLYYQKTVLTPLTPLVASGRNSDSFIANFPTNSIDPGPRTGTFPTNPYLVNGPFLNRDLLTTAYPPGVITRNTGTVRFDDPNRKQPSTRQYSIGYQRQISNEWAVTTDFLYADSKNLLMLLDLNPATRATQLATGAVTRTNPIVGTVGEFAGRVDMLTNAGSALYKSFQLAATKRISHGYTLRVSYALSKATGNTTAGGESTIDSQYLTELRLDTLEGPTSVDRPHILSVNGTWDVPKTGGLRLSSLFSARSGTPFSLIDTTFDRDQNGLTTNEWLPAGTYSGTGADSITVENAGGRNGVYGPNYMTVDFRAGYHNRLPGGKTLDTFIDVFNLTNHVNYASPSGDRRIASTFLKLTSTIGATRTAQFNVRLGF